MDPFLIWLYLALLVAAGVAGAGLHGPRRAPIATMVAFGLAAVPSLLQLTVAPGLFETLRRDRPAIADGEVWRLLTSFAVQDSGWSGTIFNLLALAILGTMAERLWGTTRWIVLVLTVQILGGLWALVTLPVGAGSSLVVFGLAAALAMTAVLSGPNTRTRVLGAVSLVAGLVLLVLGDVHGGAAVVGAAFAAVIKAARR